MPESAILPRVAPRLNKHAKLVSFVGTHVSVLVQVSSVCAGSRDSKPVGSRLASNWVRLVPNETNLGLFKFSFSTFWLAEPKCTETDLKKSQICSIWDLSDPIWMPNLTSLMRMCITLSLLHGRHLIIHLIDWHFTSLHWYVYCDTCTPINYYLLDLLYTTIQILVEQQQLIMCSLFWDWD